MKSGKLIATAVAALALGMTPVAAQNEAPTPQAQTPQAQDQQTNDDLTTGSLGTDLATAKAGDLVQLSGTARDIEEGGFTLEHADGSIDVKIEDENLAAANDIREGEKVRVSGLLEDGWISGRSIQAHSVDADAPGGAAPAGAGDMNKPDALGDDGAMGTPDRY